ncbi:MAG TPA: type II toxin-antitoxin system PemK/MazF family toxin [Gemmataceae bacterium]|nr:type II toxin-antitoxin system PemK/MazF family toxin [Gemmataceae bacterium]
MIRRGDVVVVDFPFTDTGQSKVRPALVVQNDRDNQRIRKTVIAMITGNLRRRSDPSHLFVDPNAADGASSGLGFPSLVSCNNLFTIEQASIQHVIGHLSDTLKQQLGGCLKAALELP